MLTKVDGIPGVDVRENGRDGDTGSDCQLYRTKRGKRVIRYVLKPRNDRVVRVFCSGVTWCSLCSHASDAAYSQTVQCIVRKMPQMLRRSSRQMAGIPVHAKFVRATSSESNTGNTATDRTDRCAYLKS